jgi:hypothetical protein
MIEPPRVWSRRRPINYAKQAEMVGGIAAPLLAGFSLTTVAQLVIGRDQPWLASYAIVPFAFAAALLLNTLQFSATALGYAATPSERLDLNPEAAFDAEILHVVRGRQWEEMDLRSQYMKRARFCYNTGLFAFLGGLGLIIVPHHDWPWPVGRLIGVIVVGLSLLVEALWILSDAKWPKWLLPSTSAAQPPNMHDHGAKYLFGDREHDEIAGSLRRCVELLEQVTTRHQTPWWRIRR